MFGTRFVTDFRRIFHIERGAGVIRRRAFLATAMTTPSTVIAGCGLPDLGTEHTNPTVTHDDHDSGTLSNSVATTRNSPSWVLLRI
jgi:hypothetical protein